MPIEDGMRKATENLDEAAGAAPTSKDIRDDDPEQQHSEDHNKDEEARQSEAEAPHEESGEG